MLLEPDILSYSRLENFNSFDDDKKNDALVFFVAKELLLDQAWAEQFLDERILLKCLDLLKNRNVTLEKPTLSNKIIHFLEQLFDDVEQESVSKDKITHFTDHYFLFGGCHTACEPNRQEVSSSYFTMKNAHVAVLKMWVEQNSLQGIEKLIENKDEVLFLSQAFFLSSYYEIPSLKEALCDFSFTYFFENRGKMLELGLVAKEACFIEKTLSQIQKKVPFLHIEYHHHNQFMIRFLNLEGEKTAAAFNDSISFLEELFTVMTLYHSTVFLSIGDIEPLKGGEKALFSLIKQFCPLTSLSLDCNSWLTKKTVIWVAKISQDRLLHLRFNQCFDFDDEAIFALQKFCPNLQACYFHFHDEDHYSDISQEACFSLFDSCKELKTLRFYNSKLAPSCNGDGYQVGVLNTLEKKFPNRQICLNYDFNKWG